MGGKIRKYTRENTYRAPILLILLLVIVSAVHCLYLAARLKLLSRVPHSIMDKWRGKSALVTGANSGIGAAVTRKLLQLGMVVAALDKQTEYLQVGNLNGISYAAKKNASICTVVVFSIFR